MSSSAAKTAPNGIKPTTRQRTSMVSFIYSPQLVTGERQIIVCEIGKRLRYTFCHSARHDSIRRVGHVAHTVGRRDVEEAAVDPAQAFSAQFASLGGQTAGVNHDLAGFAQHIAVN